MEFTNHLYTIQCNSVVQNLLCLMSLFALQTSIRIIRCNRQFQVHIHTFSHIQLRRPSNLSLIKEFGYFQEFRYFPELGVIKDAHIVAVLLCHKIT